MKQACAALGLWGATWFTDPLPEALLVAFAVACITSEIIDRL